MSVQFKFFWVSAQNSSSIENDLNHFLSSVHVLKIQKEFVSNGSDSHFCILVEYIKSENQTSNSSTYKNSSSKKKVDYREILSPEDFSLYDTIRTWRKVVAQKEAVQLYTILTNEQMSIIAQKRINTLNGLKEIEGLGDTRIDKYGKEIIEIVVSETQKQEKNNK